MQEVLGRCQEGYQEAAGPPSLCTVQGGEGDTPRLQGLCEMLAGVSGHTAPHSLKEP